MTTMVSPIQRSITEPPIVRRLLIGLTLGFLTLFLFLPLAAVFYEALRKGIGVYLAAIVDPDAVAAIRLTEDLYDYDGLAHPTEHY